MVIRTIFLSLFILLLYNPMYIEASENVVKESETLFKEIAKEIEKEIEKEINTIAPDNLESISIDSALMASSLNLQLSLSKAEETNKNLNSLITNTKNIVLEEEKLFYKLETLLQVISNNPVLIIEFIKQINGLKKAMEATIRPLVVTQNYLLAQRSEAEILKKAFSSSVKDKDAPETQKIIQKNTLLIQKLESILNNSQRQLDTILPKTKIFISKINETLTKTRELLPEKLQAKYSFRITSVLFSSASWENLWHDLALWKSNIEFRLIISIPTTKAELLSVVQKFILTFLLTLIPLLYILQKNKNSFSKKEFTRLSFYTFSLCLGFASGIAAFHDRGLSFSWLIYISVGIMLLSILSIVWFFKQKYYYTKETHHAPLLFPALCALIGNLCLFIVLPSLLTKIIWLILLLLLILTHKVREKSISATKASLLIHYLLVPFFILSIFFPTEWIILTLTTIVMTSLILEISLSTNIYLKRMLVKKLSFVALPVKTILGGLSTLASYFVGCTSLILWFYIVPEGYTLLNYILMKDINLAVVSFKFINLFVLIIVFYICKILVKAIQEILLSLKTPFPDISQDIMQPLQTTVTYAAWAIFIFLSLSLLGIDLKNLTIILGGLSVGIGFGLQTIFNNFFSGLILIFGRIVREGDILELPDATMGKVVKVNMRATIIENYSNGIVFVPNSELASKQFTNLTRNNTEMRREIAVPVPYGADVDFVKELLIESTKNNPDIKDDPPPHIIFKDYAASNLDFRLRFYVADLSRGLSITSTVREKITKLFAEHNIVMPFQQIDVFIKKE